MPRASSRSASSSLRTAPHGVEAELLQMQHGGLADPGRGAGHEHGSGGHCGAAYSLASPAVDVEEAIRTRRTHKAYGPEPVPRETLDELFELARWAPNHNLTNPWRFRVVGPESLARLKEAAGEEAAAKLDRAPTLVVVSVVRERRPAPGRGGPTPRPRWRRTSSCSPRTPAGSPATGARPAVLRTPGGLRGGRRAGRRAGDRPAPPGPARQEKEPPERLPPGDFVTYLP